MAMVIYKGYNTVTEQEEIRIVEDVEYRAFNFGIAIYANNYKLLVPWHRVIEAME